jgi:hypothetical protein
MNEKTYLTHYLKNRKKWDGGNIEADNWKEAEDKVDAIKNSLAVDGELVEDLVEKYLGEDRESSIKSKQAQFKSMGFKFHPKWEEFVKKNYQIIKKEEDKIKKYMSSMMSSAQKKYYKSNMEDLLSKVTDLWGSMSESALPAGFEDFGFDVDDTKPAKKDEGVLPDDIQRGSIVKIGKFKWEVFKRTGTYSAWGYKHPSKKRKAYEITSVGKGNFEVWQTGGSGQRLKSKPEVTGKLKKIK